MTLEKNPSATFPTRPSPDGRTQAPECPRVLDADK